MTTAPAPTRLSRALADPYPDQAAAEAANRAFLDELVAAADRHRIATIAVIVETVATPPAPQPEGAQLFVTANAFDGHPLALARLTAQQQEQVAAYVRQLLAREPAVAVETQGGAA